MEAYKRVEIPHHVQRYINTELSMYKTYKASVERMLRDVTDIKAQSKSYRYDAIGGGSGYVGDPAQDSAIRIMILEEKIRAQEWRIKNVERGLELFKANVDAVNIINQKYFSGADFDNQQVMAAIGLASNRNKYYELLNLIQYKFGVIFGVMP